jgi:hypothetical protein
MAVRRDVEMTGYMAFADRRGLEAAGPSADGSAFSECGSDWADLPIRAAGGANNAYAWRCAPYGGSAMPGSDTLLTSHVDAKPAARLDAGRVYLESSVDGTGRLLFPSQNVRVDNDPLNAINAFEATGYYVSTSSAGAAGAAPLPSLRAKRLSRRNNAARIVDEEIRTGIEDLQIEFGIGSAAPAQPGSDPVERFVSADALAPTDRVLAVRVWLLARSAEKRAGQAPVSVPAYSDRAARTFTDGYRRRLVSTTIAIDRASGK